MACSLLQQKFPFCPCLMNVKKNLGYIFENNWKFYSKKTFHRAKYITKGHFFLSRAWFPRRETFDLELSLEWKAFGTGWKTVFYMLQWCKTLTINKMSTIIWCCFCMTQTTDMNKTKKLNFFTKVVLEMVLFFSFRILTF